MPLVEKLIELGISLLIYAIQSNHTTEDEVVKKIRAALVAASDEEMKRELG